MLALALNLETFCLPFFSSAICSGSAGTMTAPHVISFTPLQSHRCVVPSGSWLRLVGCPPPPRNGMGILGIFPNRIWLRLSGAPNPEGVLTPNLCHLTQLKKALATPQLRPDRTPQQGPASTSLPKMGPFWPPPRPSTPLISYWDAWGPKRHAQHCTVVLVSRCPSKE